MGSGDRFTSSTSRSTETNESQPQERPLTLDMNWCSQSKAAVGLVRLSASKKLFVLSNNEWC